MNELLTIALEEADAHARTLPSAPIGVVVLVFAADGTCAPMTCVEPEHAETVAVYLPNAAHGAAVQLAEQIVEQRGDPIPSGHTDLIEAERITRLVIAKAKG